MFMQQQSGNNCYALQNENVYCFVNQQQPCNPIRYRSCFSAKVRWDTWLEKKGCCKSIGPPPKLGMNCPEHFLRKHSRQVPVFFGPEELRVTQKKEDYLKRYIYKEPPAPKKEPGLLDTGRSGKKFRPGNYAADDPVDPYPRPPSRLGLFRSNKEPSYEQKYIINKPEDCYCDLYLWQDFQDTEEAGNMSARMESNSKINGGRSGRGGGDGPSNEGGAFKDFVRANAIRAIRMPPRRLRRCYVDPCGVHLIDMSDSPFVLRPGFGKVPAYLCRRKMQLLQEDMNAKRNLGCENSAEEGDDIQMVNEEEKELVIKGLKDYWADLLNQYNSMPMSDTGNERQRELKHDLEERMKEVEADLRMLTSASTLFVGDVKSSRYL